MVIINCKQCNKEIETYPSRVGRKKFCSKECNASYNMRGNKYALGNKTWLGKKHKELSKLKMSVANKGKHLSINTEFKKGDIPANKGQKNPLLSERNRLNNPCKCGSENHNWKGGITPANAKIRNSLEMKLWKKACLERDNFTCQKTGQVGGKLEAHHINNFADFPELRTSIDNGITLSESAHKEFHKIYGKKNNTKEQIDSFLSSVAQEA